MNTPTPDEVGSLCLGGREVAYCIVRSRRARLTRLVVGPEARVRIVVPFSEPLPDPASVLTPHSRWIAQQLDRVMAIQSVAPLGSGDTVMFRGRDLRLQVRFGVEQCVALGTIDNSISIQTPQGTEGEALWILREWMRDQARRVICARVACWAEAMQVHYQRVAIKDQRSRWGSCSSLGNLNFNWRLVMAPPEVLDYVVVHELMHLFEPNHGPGFWKGVTHWCPEQRRQRAWLRQHGTLLSELLPRQPPTRS
ncbi:MAG: M48 family metallopeptidase [Chloroflexota bacterium]